MTEQEIPEPTEADVESAASDPANTPDGGDGGEPDDEEES